MLVEKISVVLIIVLLCVVLIGNRGQKDKEHKVEPEYVIGQMRVQTLQGFDFLYVSVQTTEAEIVKTIHELGAKGDRAFKKAKATTGGPGVIIYRDSGEPSEIILELGGMARAGTKPVGETKGRKVEPFRCATLVFCGAYKHLGKAYAELEQGMKRAGLKGTGGYREFYLYEEGDESPNNTLLLQAGIKE